MLFVVDEERELRDLLIEFLALHGYTVQTAENGS
jgi:DNA-binding response OmpR family regulator